MSTNEEKHAGIPYRRALELLLQELCGQRDGVNAQITMVKEKLAGDPVPDAGAAPPTRTRGPRSCGKCGELGHDSRVCPTKAAAPPSEVPSETV